MDHERLVMRRGAPTAHHRPPPTHEIWDDWAALTLTATGPSRASSTKRGAVGHADPDAGLTPGEQQFERPCRRRLDA